MRLRDVSVTWDLPRVLTPWQRTTASLTVSGHNLGLWTRYDGDPEVVSMISENANGGAVQYAQPTFLTMPQARRWTTRLTLNF